MTRLPSKRRALAILREAGCSPPVIRHCRTVSKLAVEIAEACKKRGMNVDIKLVEIGALLHDLGRARTHSIDHGVVGARIARSMGVPPPIILIIERHLLAGITAEEAKVFGLPVKDYLPQTIEEKIIVYADKRVEGAHPVDVSITVSKLTRWLGADHPIIKRLKQLNRDFSAIIEEADKCPL